uniref:POM121 transmembrane nucleoporin like 2 n=1 Tax=Molossus molossus TaxID=27622 RepID=A0A7J8HBX7_MOLMO|nr:hypothetical protein HJG59_011146 [Molossus molossus]
MSASESEMSSSSVSVGGRATLGVAQEQVVTPMSSTTRRGVRDACTAQTDVRACGESAKGMARREEDPTALARRAGQGRGPDGPGEAQSAFRPLGGQGGLSSFVPRPGPLQGIQPAHSSEDTCHSKSQASVIHSCPRRNAISSSYSSTQGFPPVQRSGGAATCQARLPQRPSKPASQGGLWAPSAASAVSQRQNQQEKDPDGTSGQKGSPRNCSPASDSSRPPKRKVPLLPHRRGEPLRLPSPPQPGYRVTAEDLAAERKAVLQRIHSALGGEAEAIAGYAAPEPWCSSLQPAAMTASVTVPSTPPSTSLSVTSAVIADPSTSTSADLAPQATFDTEVTPMDTTPPICALKGAPWL